jgi:hypothetical protein
MNLIEKLIRAGIPAFDAREIYEWAGGTLPDHSDAMINFGNTTSFRGRYDANNVPWTKEILRALKNPHVREVVVVMPPQASGKTKMAELFMVHRQVTSPTNIGWFTSTNVKADQFSETRLEAMFNSVRGFDRLFSRDRNLKKRRRIVYEDGTYLIIQGAETEGNRASDSYEVVVCDEAYLYETPWLREIVDRTEAYRDTRKILIISVGGMKGSELEQRFQAGNQMELHHHCPRCQQPFPYIFNFKNPRCNIRFDKEAAILHADGRLDLREFAKTVYVFCPQPECGHKMFYDRERLSDMNRNSVYIPMNPGADPSTASFHANAFALGREPWHEILEPWVRLYIRGGVFAAEPHREFITKKLAEFWDDAPHFVTTELKLAGWTRAECIRLKSWLEEKFRVMICDNQRGAKGDIPHRWFVCVAFSDDGRMRVIDAGRLNEWEEVRKKQIELGIPDPTEAKPGPFVVVDRRWDAEEVDQICAQYKWTGSMGSSQDEFVHPPYSQFAGTRQLFTEPRSIDIGFGTAQMGRTYALYFLWATQRIQDKLAALRNAGRVEFPADVGTFCPELATHMNSHRQFMEADKYGKEHRVWKRIGDTPDHIYDCVCQAVVIGCMAGIYKVETTTS